MTTHKFDSTGEAYDATQCRDDVKTGDLLLIESEQVVGIADTWPVAVTVAHGHLHVPAEGITLEGCLAGRLPNMLDEPIVRAKALAKDLGWAVRP